MEPKNPVRAPALGSARQPAGDLLSRNEILALTLPQLVAKFLLDLAWLPPQRSTVRLASLL